VYSNAVEFFADLLAQSYVREVNEGAAYTRCPEWYKHPEAIIRMVAIWRAWEHLRLEPALGVSTWWLNQADPHTGVLMGK
jgi:homoserine trans-succinylase